MIDTFTLTLNGVTIEYPTNFAIAIRGLHVRFIDGPKERVPSRRIVEPESVLEDEVIEEIETTTKPVTTTKARKKYQLKKLAHMLPTNWKDTVLRTLRQEGGNASARMLTSRVFKGSGKVTDQQSAQLRVALRTMVKKGELLALEPTSGQTRYGLPAAQQEA